MTSDEVYQWLEERNDRKTVLRAFNQPLTSRQISKKTGIPQGICSYVIATCVDKGLLVCLNPTARRSRLYWLTEQAHHRLKLRLRSHHQLYQKPELPNIDWTLYGWVCYTHRSAIIKVLTEPLRPSEIKRILRIQRSDIRIRPGNIRDIIQLFLSKGIVHPVKIHNKAHRRYELTDSGIKFRQLLFRADAVL